MSTNIFKISLKSLIVTALFMTTWSISHVASAASHNISLSAEALPNGQSGYKMISHTSSEGGTPSYSTDPVIPGPTLFVTQGDKVNIEVTNNTNEEISFDVSGLTGYKMKNYRHPHHRGKKNPRSKIAPGESKTFKFKTNGKNAVGTHPYGDVDSALQGLFGALVVDKKDGAVQRYIDENGVITSVNRSELNKEYVLFMVGSTFWGAEIANGMQTPIWTNPTLGAIQDDLVRFHILAIGPGSHTFHLHAHRWLKEQKTKKDQKVAPAIIDTRLMDDSYFDSHTFTIKAGAGVGTGHWQYHCHLLSHMESGMTGKFHVMDAGESGDSIAGASPSGAIFLNPSPNPGLVTFEISDEPGSWFRSARGDALAPVTITKSLEIIPPGSSVHFIMSDTNAVHTMTSLIWPSDADDPTMGGDQHMIPFDQTKAYRGGGIVKLDVPGLYVFTCKVHPYMFAAVIVDDPGTAGLDLGDSIDLVMGVNGLPTSSDLATRLLRTFFIATTQGNWQDYTSATPWHVGYPDVPVEIDLGTVNLKDVLESRYDQDIVLDALFNPVTPGVGEVWIDTQFEQTAGKTKPGTITVLDASDWTIKRKISLPQINMNHPHNIWSNQDQSIIYQTQWFDDKLTFIKQKNGKLIKNIQIGNSPSHVVTVPGSDEITVAINGENGVVRIPAGSTVPELMMPTQLPGQPPANPHGHWITSDGTKIVTPNINTSDAGIYDVATGNIEARVPTFGNFPAGPHPIAIGMGTDRFYVANLLDNSLSVIGTDGTPIKTIDLIADYDPVPPTESGANFFDGDGNGIIAVGVLPIQTPVDPTGRVVVTANTGGQITIVDVSKSNNALATDDIVAMLPCDPGCHGVNYGAKQGGGYYAYVTSKFSNELIVVDPDPNNNNDFSDAAIVGRISMVDNSAPTDDAVVGLAGTGGQGIYAVPNVYNGWVQNLPDNWKTDLTPAQLNPVP